ncbi:MAG: insulinase family protein [Nitrospirae bacterium]|nr:MAG: insulinase family protein [Nitrospirota bacterium]
MERMPSLKSVAVGIWVNVGARDEQLGQEGITHFLEHMMFKGTRRRSAVRISQEIDMLGGEMNAFTTHETTTFYVKVLDQQLTQALDLLADLFHHSQFDVREIEREKQVVLEEIRTVRDDPEDFVQELHAQAVWRDHPLGRSILGEPATMERIGRQDLVQYVKTHYRPEHTLITIAGNVTWSSLLPLIDELFGSWTAPPWPNGAPPTRRPPAVHGGISVHAKRLEQTHLCLGFKGLPLGHPDRYAANTLNVLLGGGVSSRLFQEVRERRGLAYTIYSQLSSFTDGGTLTIYAATNAKEAASVIAVICREIQKLRRRPVGHQELERAKNQMKGTLMLNLEGTYGRMTKLAKDEISHGRHVTLEEMIAEIDKLSSTQLQRVSRELLDFGSMTVTALGPLPKGDFVKRVSNLVP